MIEFSTGKHLARVILLDRPFKGVIGIAECGKAPTGVRDRQSGPRCAWRKVLTIEETGRDKDGGYDHEKLTAVVIEFMERHTCCQAPS